MSNVHSRILQAALSGLDKEQAAYFADLARMVEEDPRTERAPNMVYLVLADTIRHLPAYLDKKELLARLYRFVDRHYGSLQAIIYSPAFIADKTVLRNVTASFVTEIVEATMVRYEQGDIDGGEPTVHRLSFDQRGGSTMDFPYVDDDDLDDDLDDA